MGNAQVSWKNTAASECLQFLTFLFGKPYVLVRSRGGVAVWNSNDLSAKTLFGKNICFEKIMIKDSDSDNHLYVFASAPVEYAQACELHKISSGVGYDDIDKMIWVRSTDLDSAICTFRYVTDFLVGKNNVQQSAVAHTDNVKNIRSNDAKGRSEITKAMYNVLCVNLTKLLTSGSKDKPALNASTEHMYDDPWYGGYGPYYASNDPGNIALGEAEDEMFYRRQTETPVIFPKVEHLAVSKQCKGACLQRVAHLEHMTPIVPHPNSNITIAQAYQLFKPNARYEHMALMNSGSHLGRLERMQDMNIRKLFQSGTGVAKISVGTETFDTGADLTWGDAVKLFVPKSALNTNLAYRSQALTLNQGLQSLTPRSSLPFRQ